MSTDHTWPASDPTHGYGSPAPRPLRSKSAAAAGTAVLSPVAAKGKSAELLGPHMGGVRSPAAKKAIAQRRKLYACLALLVISGAGVQIYMRRALAALHNYSYFVFQSGAIAYFPIVLAVTLFKFMFTKDITPDMVRASLVPKFLLMALLDSCEDFAVIIGTAHTTVALQTLLPQVWRRLTARFLHRRTHSGGTMLLGQGVLPVTMLFSLLWLKVSYSSKHYAAAVCIMAGVVVVVLPSFSRHVVNGAWRSSCTRSCVELTTWLCISPNVFTKQLPLGSKCYCFAEMCPVLCLRCTSKPACSTAASMCSTCPRGSPSSKSSSASP